MEQKLQQEKEAIEKEYFEFVNSFRHIKRYDVQGEKIVWFEVPRTGEYRITAAGASGADFPDNKTKGGRGARAEGVVSLKRGDQLEVIVGGLKLTP